MLTRTDVTAAVHYVRFPVGGDRVERFSRGPVSLAVRHPAYEASTELPADVRRELLGDLLA